MKDTVPKGFERWLRSVTLKPSPPDLRHKVLKAAAEYRERKAWTTPLLRRCFAACAAVLLVVFVADGLVSRAQRDRFIALAGGPRPAPMQPDDDRALLTEVLGESTTPEMLARERAELRRRNIRISRADDYLQLERLMEDGNESQKDPH